eukprot:1587445-Rhodomonas_salina.1
MASNQIKSHLPLLFFAVGFLFLRFQTCSSSNLLLFNASSCSSCNVQQQQPSAFQHFAFSSLLVTRANYLSNTLTFYSSLATRSNFICHCSSSQSDSLGGGNASL